MKKALFVLIAGFLLVFSGNAFAFMEVPSYGATGWQSFTYTFDKAWIGNIGFGVSNYADQNLDSYLLVDNIQLGSSVTNGSFESGDFTGYALSGTGSVVTSATSYYGTVFTPTNGNYMALLQSEGVDTSYYGGTNGAILMIAGGPVSFGAGDTVSFNWNFLAGDYVPFQDFAFLIHSSSSVTNDGEEKWDKLAQINAVDNVVPEPATMSLLGMGLFGLLGLRKRRG